MKKCPKCGNMLDEDANACGACGVWLADVGGAVEVEAASAEDALSSMEKETRPQGDIPADMAIRMDSVPEVPEDSSMEAVDDIEKDFEDILRNVGNIAAEVEKNIPSNSEINDDIDKEMNSVNNGGGKWNRKEQKGHGEDKASPVQVTDIKQEGMGDCKFLKVSINYNDLAVSGHNSVIQLEITQLSEELDKIELYWTLKDDRDMSQIRIDQKMHTGESISIGINFIEDKPGFCYAKFFFLCKMKNGCEHRYVFSHTIRIYNNQETVGAYNFYIDNTQKASEAGYIRDNVINIATQPVSQNQLLDQLRLMPQYGSKALSETSRKFETEIPLPPLLLSPPSYNRLLLNIGTYKLYILNKSIVRLGRVAEENDLQVRVPCKLEEESPNKSVSARHGVLVIFGGNIIYVDISSYGSRFDRKSDWVVRDTKFLPPDHSTIVEFGDIPLQMQPTICKLDEQRELCRHLKMQEGDVGSVFFSRQDNIQEGYLVVPSYCNLGEILPVANGWTLFHWKDGFVLMTPDEEYHLLAPGMSIPYRTLTMEVAEFRQQ